MLIGSGMSILCFIALRMITQRKLQDFLALRARIVNANQEHSFVDKSDNCFADEYMRVYNLTTLSHLRSDKDFFNRTIMSIFLLKCLRCSGYFASHRTLDGNSRKNAHLLYHKRHVTKLSFLKIPKYSCYTNILP